MTQIPPQAPLSIKDSVLNFNPGYWLKKYQSWLILLAVILAIFWLIKTVIFPPTAISVLGTGELSVEPASVEMLVTRVDSNPDTVVAVSQSEDSVAAILAKAKELAGDNIKVQKSFYQVTPTAVAGDVIYQVVTVIKLTVNDPSKASDLIKGIYTAGATTISNVNFIPENQDKVTQEARRAAMKDARAQARALARASGKRVGRMVSIADDQTSAGGTLSTDAGTTDLATELTSLTSTPRQIDISKTVNVTFYLW